MRFVSINVASGAGALTYNGSTGGNPYIGNDYAHYWTNNSSSTVSFLNSSWQSGGGGNHELDLYGTGNWLFGNNIQFTNAGSGPNLYLVLNGSGSVTLDGTNNGSVVAGGTAGSVTVYSGTLIFGGTNALFGTTTLTMYGGNLDCLCPNLINVNTNIEYWNRDFTFAGSQNLNLGSGSVTLEQNVQVTVSANTLTVGGAIGGGYSLTKAGGGTLELDGYGSTFTGPVVVNGGTLYVNPSGRANSNAFSCVSSITVNSGATLRSCWNGLFGWDGTQTHPITVNAGGTMTCDTNGDVAVGVVTLNGGTLAGGPNSGWGSWSFGRAPTNQLIVTDNSLVTATNVVFYNGASISVSPNKTLTISGTVDNSLDYYDYRGASYPYSGQSSIIQTGSGTLVLSGANTYTGGTTNAGTLTISGSGSLGGGSYSGGISNGGTMTFSSSVAQTLAGPVSGSGSLTVSGSTVMLSGTNTFSGTAQVIGGGVLSVSSVSKALGNVSGINLGGSSANGTLLYTGTGETSDRVISYTAFNGSDYQPNQVIDQSGSGLLKFTGNLSQGGGRAHYLTLQGSTSGAGEIAGNISGGGGATTVVKNGTGTWTLSGNNAYTGGTVVNAGTLVVSNAAALGTAANLLTLAPNATSVVLQVAANLTSPQATTLSGGADGATGTGSVIVDTLTNKTAQLQMNPAAGPAFPGLIVRDQGLLVLSGTNTFNYFFEGSTNSGSLGGNLLITNGSFVVLQNNGNSKFDQGANVTIGSNAVFAVGSGNGNAWFPLGDTAGTTNNMTIAGGSFIVTNNYGFQVARNGDAALTINSGSVLVNDTGTLGLSMSEGNGHSTLNLNGGRLTPLLFRFGGGTETINFNGGTLTASASRTDFLPSSGETANVRNSGAVVDSAGFNITISQPLIHSGIAGDNAIDGGLTKLNSGILTLSGVSTYTGGTVVNAGTLALSNTGSISNSANITLAASGTFDVSAISTFNLSSNTVFKANGTGAAPGSTAATINGGGTVNLNTNSIILNFTPVSFSGDTTHPALLVTNASLTLNNNGITITNAAATPLGAGVYRLVQVGNGSSGSISGTPNATPVVVSGSGIAAGMTAVISVSSGNLNLTVQNITTNTLALTSGSNPSTYGNSVTFSATISPAPTNGESVAFKDGATTLGTGTISAGVAAFSISTLAFGSHSITAVYAGDVTNTASTSAALAFNVNQAVVTVASGLTANKTYDGTTTATIISNNVSLSGVVAGDAGNVHLSTNGYTASFTTASVGTGKAVTVSGLTLTGSAAGNYTLTQPTLSANITAATLTVTANNTNRIYGVSNPSFTASYSGFVNGETASVVLGTPGFSTSATNSSPVGSYVITPLVGSLTATNYSFAVFNTGSLTITKASSTNVVSSSSNPAPTGSNVTFTATLTAVGPASGTPTGTVQFLADGTALGAPATLSGGIASLTTNSLSHGTHIITAQYAGDGNFAGSTNTLSPNQSINSAPVAVSDTLQRYTTTGAKARVTALIANDTDTDGDAISLISVNAASAQGGTVTTNHGWVFYTRPAGYTNADSFTYVITDGSLQATGSVAVAIVSDTNAAQNLDLSQNLGNGSLLTSFFGIPGRTYTIQYTTNLATPNWQSLGTAAADATGRFQYTDSPGTNLPARFYRSTYP
jgi:autotransporter-associated beta strand protein